MYLNQSLNVLRKNEMSRFSSFHLLVIPIEVDGVLKCRIIQKIISSSKK